MFEFRNSSNFSQKAVSSCLQYRLNMRLQSNFDPNLGVQYPKTEVFSHIKFSFIYFLKELGQYCGFHIFQLFIVSFETSFSHKQLVLAIYKILNALISHFYQRQCHDGRSLPSVPVQIPVVFRRSWVQIPVVSDQKLENWYSLSSCLALSIYDLVRG